MAATSIVPVASEGSALELDASARGFRLAGRAVQTGTVLELKLDQCWLMGRFEWSGEAHRWPVLRVPLGGPWSADCHPRKRSIAITLPPDAQLRWPDVARS